MVKIKKLYFTIAVVAVILLSVTAVVLSMIYYQRSLTSSNAPAGPTPTPADTELKEFAKNRLFLPPNASTTDAEKDKYFSMVAKLVHKGNRLTITNTCLTDYLVLGMEKGEDIFLNNTDDIPHTITLINSMSEYRIEPKGTRKITADFGDTTGFYAYRCDGNPNMSGYFYLTVTP